MQGISATTRKIARVFPDGVPPKVVKPSPIKHYLKCDISKNAKVKFTRDGFCKVVCFSRAVYHLPGYEKNDSFERAEILQSADKEPPKKAAGERVRADSLKRAKDKVFEIVSCNDWAYMVTFTLDKEKIDRYNAAEVQKRFCKWLDNNVQRRGLYAIIIPELHEDGAIHFHGLVNNALEMRFSDTYKVKGKKKPVKLSTLRKNGKKPQDSDVKKVYNVVNYNLGFSTAIKLTGDGFDEAFEELNESISRVASYMTKYCTKDMQKIFGSYYIAVGKLKRELPYIVCNLDLESFRDCGRFYELPDNLGEICYATITTDDLKGALSDSDGIRQIMQLDL